MMHAIQNLPNIKIIGVKWKKQFYIPHYPYFTMCAGGNYLTWSSCVYWLQVTFMFFYILIEPLFETIHTTSKTSGGGAGIPQEWPETSRCLCSSRRSYGWLEPTEVGGSDAGLTQTIWVHPTSNASQRYCCTFLKLLRQPRWLDTRNHRFQNLCKKQWKVHGTSLSWLYHPEWPNRPRSIWNCTRPWLGPWGMASPCVLSWSGLWSAYHPPKICK